MRFEKSLFNGTLSLLFFIEMSYYKTFNGFDDFQNHQNYTESLRGVFISSAYESNKSKCSEAYFENFLFDTCVGKETTMARLKDICSATWLPIREVESNLNKQCNIKCEEFDDKVEIENTGPFSFQLGHPIYVFPPIPNPVVDLDRLKIELSSRQTFFKPMLVPKFEIANILDDTLKKESDSEPSYSSLLFKTYGDVTDDLFEIFASGYQFTPSGYVASKSGHEPPNGKAVEIKSFEKLVMKVVRPTTMVMPDLFRFFQ